MFLRVNSFSKSLERTSCPIMNRYTDRGSPCLNPLLGLNWLDLPPLTSTSNDTEETQANIHPMNTPLKPSLEKIPIHPVISLLEINLYGHLPCFNFSDLETVEQLLNYDLVFSYPASRDKSKLARRDESGKERPNPRH